MVLERCARPDMVRLCRLCGRCLADVLVSPVQHSHIKYLCICMILRCLAQCTELREQHGRYTAPSAHTLNPALDAQISQKMYAQLHVLCATV